jgi:hypothetical protein
MPALTRPVVHALGRKVGRHGLDSRIVVNPVKVDRRGLDGGIVVNPRLRPVKEHLRGLDTRVQAPSLHGLTVAIPLE